MKTTIEFDGITMTHTGSGPICFKYEPGQTPVIYNCEYIMAPLETSVFDVPFYIECKDDPSKLHKFCEMKYLGLVDNPHYDHVGEKLKEIVKKFDGCFVHKNYHTGTSYLITKEKIYSIGCNKGVSNVLEHVLIILPAPSGDHMAGSIFGRIDASKVPHSWTWAPSYNNEVLSMCEKLKDVEP